MTATAFKAYDIRGRVPDELNEALATRIAVAMSDLLEPGPVVIGRAELGSENFPASKR